MRLPRLLWRLPLTWETLRSTCCRRFCTRGVCARHRWDCGAPPRRSRGETWVTAKLSSKLNKRGAQSVIPYIKAWGASLGLPRLPRRHQLSGKILTPPVLFDNLDHSQLTAARASGPGGPGPPLQRSGLPRTSRPLARQSRDPEADGPNVPKPRGRWPVRRRLRRGRPARPCAAPLPAPRLRLGPAPHNAQTTRTAGDAGAAPTMHRGPTSAGAAPPWHRVAEAAGPGNPTPRPPDSGPLPVLPHPVRTQGRGWAGPNGGPPGHATRPLARPRQPPPPEQTPRTARSARNTAP